MEKIQEYFLAVATAFLGMGAWIVRMLFKRIDKLENRVDSVERTLLTKDDLDASLEPIRETNFMILKHLLEKRDENN